MPETPRGVVEINESVSEPEHPAKPRPTCGVERGVSFGKTVLNMGSNVAMILNSFRSASNFASLITLFALLAVNCVYSQEFNPRTSGVVVKHGNVVHQQGYIFLDGRYIPPPYEVQMQGTNISLNGLEVTDIDLSGYEKLRPKNANAMFGRSRFNRDRQRPNHTPAKEFARELTMTHLGTAVVVFKNRPPLVVEMSREGQDLIHTLCEPNAGEDGSFGIPESLTSEVDRETWTQLVSEFQPTTEFLTRATAQLQEQEQTQTNDSKRLDAKIFVARIEYPLTLLGMIAVVLGFGHLLSNKPLIETTSEDKSDFTQSQRIVGRSLLIVGVLSVTDLVWTIAASQSGTMRELNPLGSQLLDNPLQLIIFKLAATSTAIGLLYWLHRHPIAQVASWWSCLVLTLLTARWLTFHSMFL